MSSRPDSHPYTTGSHPVDASASGRTHQRPPERYEPYLDGLFTYCLSVLCEHDAATAVLGEVLVLAERHHGRRPTEDGLYRPWLYALARWACLRRLAERRPVRASASGRPDPGAPLAPDEDREAARRRAELAALAWPEAAGTSSEQREALELSVRHHLSCGEVAAILGTGTEATRELLSSASCEVERTRAALAVVEVGRCPDVAQLGGDTQMLLGAALRRELVRHVDECAECRRTAERVTAGGPWPGTDPAAQDALPLVAVPRTEVGAAMSAAWNSRSGRAEGVPGAVTGSRAGRVARAAGKRGADDAPRYDRGGFPLGPRDRAARRRRLRRRVLTTTVVATVLAAPLLALWAAYRGTAPTDEAGGDTPSVTANETNDRGGYEGAPYENAGSAHSTPDPRFTAGSRSPDLAVAVLGADGQPLGEAEPLRSRSGPGRLAVAAHAVGGATAVVLTASGGAPVHWSARSDAPWLRLSTSDGELRPGEVTTLTVRVDHEREPAGHWRTRILFDPGGTAVALEGRGAAGHGRGPGTRTSGSSSPSATRLPSGPYAPASTTASAPVRPSDPGPRPTAPPAPTDSTTLSDSPMPTPHPGEVGPKG
ncbi:sigma-70 family RNA polymerase sigma factor [Streptomyces sp. NPDC003077]|uniref:BACON domain-containing protein n=1 Tax=Streptomyces sp. NPDC003077 TaxID=3154443 RepID=UPI0033A30A30